MKSVKKNLRELTHYKFYFNIFETGLRFFVVISNSKKVFYKTSLLSDS